MISQEDYQRALDCIHLEIGRAVTEWSCVEEFIYSLYELCVISPGHPIPLGLSSSFASVIGFRAKLSMIDALIQNSGSVAEIKIKQIADWKLLKRQIEKCSSARNKLAHGSIISPSISFHGEITALPVWVPYYERQSYKIYKLGARVGDHLSKRKFEEWSAGDIQKVHQEFRNVQMSISKYFDIHFPSASRE